MNAGDYIWVQVENPRFGKGAWVYELIEKDLLCPHCKGNDGMKFRMLDGEGFSAIPGREIIDCEKILAGNIAEKITQIISKEKAMKLVDCYVEKSKE